MTDEEIQRRVRGRVRKMRRKRLIQRYAAFGSFVMAAVAIGASLSVNLIKQERVRVLPPQVQTFKFPERPVVVAQVEPQMEKKSSPRLLNLDKLFPRYRKKQHSTQIAQADPSEKTTEPVEDVVILDDLRAAPPKTMFLDAIFQTSKTVSRDPLPPITLSIDFTNSMEPEFTSGPVGATVPEPGTGVLLGLGLGGISLVSRGRRRRRLQAAAARTSASNNAPQ